MVSKRDLLMIINLYSKTAYANPLNPDAFPGIRKMEAEVVRMCCNLFNGDPDTSCGTVRKWYMYFFLFKKFSSDQETFILFKFNFWAFNNYTVADYRPFTVRLQLKTLLPCILLLTAAVKVQLRWFTIEITGKSLATVQKTIISIVDYLYIWGQIL